MRMIDMRPPRIGMVLTLLAATLHWSTNGWKEIRVSWLPGGVILGLVGFSIMMWSRGSIQKKECCNLPNSENNEPYNRWSLSFHEKSNVSRISADTCWFSPRCRYGAVLSVSNCLFHDS